MDLSEIKDQIKEKSKNIKKLSYFEKSTTLTIFLSSIACITINSLEIVDNKILNIFGALTSVLVLVNDYTKYHISKINEKIQNLEKEKLEKLEKVDKIYKVETEIKEALKKIEKLDKVEKLDKAEIKVEKLDKAEIKVENLEFRMMLSKPDETTEIKNISNKKLNYWVPFCNL